MKMIPPFFYLLLLVALHIYGANDSDFDGVDDIHDKCPNTPFSDLADTSGCTTTSLYTPTHYDIIMGYNYASSNPNTLEDTKTSSTMLQADLYHGNFSAQIQSSYYRSDGSSINEQGWNDTLLSLSYLFKPSDSLLVQAGVGIIFPTYSTGYHNEETDYLASMSLRYSLNKEINLFGGYNYTLINDTDIPNIASYQNTNTFYAGLGYMSNKNSSINFSYSNAKSIYVGVNPIEALSCGTMVPINTHWFVMGDYRYGLSDSASDHEASLRIGYAF